MKISLGDLSNAGASSKAILLASGALLLSALMQMATAWMQMRSQQSCETRSNRIGVTIPSPDFDNQYTWIGDDFPNALPIDLGDPVVLTIEDSRHYALDTPEADDEYQSIYPGDHLGFVRLGPNQRFFSLSMYHQIHCLDSLRQAILGRGHHSTTPSSSSSSNKRDVEHSQHCLNYLRQTILCSADLTLEPEIVEDSQEVGEGLGVTHVCRDWSKVHVFIEGNEVAWKMWANRTRT